MDGTRDRLPDRMIETWGRSYMRKAARRSDARANGPVRTSFAAAAAVSAPDVLIDVAAPDAPPAPDPAAPPPQAADGRIAAKLIAGLRRGRTGATLPVSLGAVALIAILSAGVLLRSQVEAESAPVPALAAEAGPLEDPAAQPAAAMATVHLRVGAGLARADRQRIEAALAQAGYRNVMVHEMPFSISTSRVGYFHEDDRASAEALMRALGGTLDGLELRDYRALVQSSEPGRLDLWIRS